MTKYKISFFTLSVVTALVPWLSRPQAQAQTPDPTQKVSAPSPVPKINEEPLVTDRPDFTESPQTVPDKRVQFEGGISFERNGQERQTNVGDDTLVRIGAGKKAEIRIGVPSYLLTRQGGRTSGSDDAFLGTKVVLSSNPGQPLALLVGTTLPTGSRRIAEHRYQPEAVLATSLSLAKRIDLGLNLGAARPTDQNERFSQIFGSASFGFGLSERMGAFAEVFAFNRTEAGGSSQKFADAGFTYLLNPNLQVDIRAGLGINNHVNGPNDFYGAGISRRF